METYESSVKKVAAKPEDIYKVVSDMNNVAKVRNMIPASMMEQHADKLKILETMECDTNSVYFSAPMVGRMGLLIVDKEENKLVKFGGNPSPCDFNFWIQMKETGPNESAIKLTLKADLPFALKLMVGSKIKDGIEKLADTIAKIPFDRVGKALV